MASNISSFVIDWLGDQVDNREVAIARLYSDYLAQAEQSAVNMLGAILNQFLEKDGILVPVRQALGKGKRGFGGQTRQVSDLVKMIDATDG